MIDTRCSALDKRVRLVVLTGEASRFRMSAFIISRCDGHVVMLPEPEDPWGRLSLGTWTVSRLHCKRPSKQGGTVSPTTIPDLSDPAADRRITETLEGLATDQSAKLDAPSRRRLREILMPQANGDQDTW